MSQMFKLHYGDLEKKEKFCLSVDVSCHLSHPKLSKTSVHGQETGQKTCCAKSTQEHGRRT